MSEKTKRLHEVYAKQNYECMMRKDIEGMMYWTDQIDKLLQSSNRKDEEKGMRNIPKLEYVKNAVCPACDGHRIVKYTYFQSFYGCLNCGWKELL